MLTLQVRLLSMLNEYKNLREEKEEEKRRLRVQAENPLSNLVLGLQNLKSHNTSNFVITYTSGSSPSLDDCDLPRTTKKFKNSY